MVEGFLVNRRLARLKAEHGRAAFPDPADVFSAVDDNLDDFVNLRRPPTSARLARVVAYSSGNRRRVKRFLPKDVHDNLRPIPAAGTTIRPIAFQAFQSAPQPHCTTPLVRVLL